MRLTMIAIGLAGIVATSAGAQETVESLEAKWREAKRAQLIKELATASARVDVISRQLTALTKGATPDTLPTATIGAVVTPANGDGQPSAGKPEVDKSVSAKASAGDKAISDPNKPVDEPSGTRSFAGLKFGAGLSVTKDVGKRDRIGDARLDANGLVRVFDRNNVPARVMIESHYFFTPCYGFLNIRYNECEYVKDETGKKWRQAVKNRERWGWGPFVALQPGGDDVIDAIGMGLMVGFRRNLDTNESFNFGVGYVVDPNTKVLGKGVRENQLLPTGETEIRLEETTQTGLLFLASFSF